MTSRVFDEVLAKALAEWRDRDDVDARDLAKQVMSHPSLSRTQLAVALSNLTEGLDKMLADECLELLKKDQAMTFEEALIIARTLNDEKWGPYHWWDYDEPLASRFQALPFEQQMALLKKETEALSEAGKDAQEDLAFEVSKMFTWLSVPEGTPAKTLIVMFSEYQSSDSEPEPEEWSALYAAIAALMQPLGTTTAIAA